MIWPGAWRTLLRAASAAKPAIGSGSERPLSWRGNGGVDYFCTTLSISPFKGRSGHQRHRPGGGEQADVRWLPSDFKNGEDTSGPLSWQGSMASTAKTIAAVSFFPEGGNMRRAFSYLMMGLIC